MKTLPEFLALPLEQQFDYLWNNCQQLASREEEEGKLLVSLYYGSGLLVEVCFDQNGNIIRIRPYTKYRSFYKESFMNATLARVNSAENNLSSN